MDAMTRKLLEELRHYLTVTDGFYAAEMPIDDAARTLVNGRTRPGEIEVTSRLDHREFLERIEEALR